MARVNSGKHTNIGNSVPKSTNFSNVLILCAPASAYQPFNLQILEVSGIIKDQYVYSKCISEHENLTKRFQGLDIKKI